MSSPKFKMILVPLVQNLKLINLIKEAIKNLLEQGDRQTQLKERLKKLIRVAKIQ